MEGLEEIQCQNPSPNYWNWDWGKGRHGP